MRLYDIDGRGPFERRDPFLTSIKPGRSFTGLMRFSPTGTLALGGWGGKIELWDPAAASRVAALPGSEQSLDLAFSPDGRTLAAVGQARVTSIWSIQDSAARTQLSGFDARIASLAFGPKGVLAGGGWDGKVWTWRSGRCPEAGLAVADETDSSPERAGSRSRAPAPGPGPQSPGGSGAHAAGPDPKPPARDEPSGQRHDPRRPRGDGARVPTRPRERPTWVAFDVDGRLLAHDYQGLSIWPAGPDAVRAKPDFHELAVPRAMFPITPIARTPDGRIMALLRSASVYLWRSEAPDRLVPVVPPPDSSAAAGTAPAVGNRPPVPFRAIQIAPHGDRIYLIDLAHQLHIWDIAGSPADPEWHAKLPSRDLSAVKEISSFALRRDGELLATADRSGNISLTDTVRRRIRGSIRPSADESGSVYSSLAFSPDGSTLAVGSQTGTIALHSVESPDRPRLRFRLPGPGHPGMVASLVFDTSGTRLASTSWPDPPVVEVWDLDLIGRELKRLGLADDPR